MIDFIGFIVFTKSKILQIQNLIQTIINIISAVSSELILFLLLIHHALINIKIQAISINSKINCSGNTKNPDAYKIDRQFSCQRELQKSYQSNNQFNFNQLQRRENLNSRLKMLTNNMQKQLIQQIKNDSINSPKLEISQNQCTRIKAQRLLEKLNSNHTQNVYKKASVENLSLYKDYDPDQLSEIQLLQTISRYPNDLEWFTQYLNIPSHNTYDTKLMRFYPSKELTKLYYTRLSAKAYLHYGYGERQFKVFTQCSEETKKKYPGFIYQVVRIVIKKVEGYLIEQGQAVKGIDFRGVNTLSMPLYRVTESFDKQFCDTYFRIMRIVFRIKKQKQLPEDFDGLLLINSQMKEQSKNQYPQVSYIEMMQFYDKLLQKIQARSTFRKSIPSKKQNFVKNYPTYFEHYIYNEGIVPQEFGNLNGINGLVDIFILDQKSSNTDRQWTHEFTIEFLKLYLQKFSLPMIRDIILERFPSQINRIKFDLKCKLKGKFQNTIRKVIKKCQQDFRHHLQHFSIHQINFYQMKFLTLNDSQIRVIVFREEGLEVRRCLIDYWINNHKQTNLDVSEDKIKYKLTYLNYIIEGMSELLQRKKHLASVLKESISEKNKNYELQTLKISRTEKRALIQIQEQNQTVTEFIFNQMKIIKKQYNREFQPLDAYIIIKDTQINQKIKIRQIKIQNKIEALYKNEEFQSLAKIQQGYYNNFNTQIKLQTISKTPIKLEYTEMQKLKKETQSILNQIHQENSFSQSTFSLGDSDEQKFSQKEKQILQKTTHLIKKSKKPGKMNKKKNFSAKQINSKKNQQKNILKIFEQKCIPEFSLNEQKKGENSKQDDQEIDYSALILKYDECEQQNRVTKEKIAEAIIKVQKYQFIQEESKGSIEQNNTSREEIGFPSYSTRQINGGRLSQKKTEFENDNNSKLRRNLGVFPTIGIKINPSIEDRSILKKQFQSHFRSQILVSKYQAIREQERKKLISSDLYTIPEESYYQNKDKINCLSTVPPSLNKIFFGQRFFTQNMGSRYYRPKNTNIIQNLSINMKNEKNIIKYNSPNKTDEIKSLQLPDKKIE